MQRLFQTCVSWQGLQELSDMEPDASDSNYNRIIYCEGMMGFYSPATQQCEICEETRSDEKPMWFYHESKEILAHYDCVPCDRCHKSIPGRGVCMTKSGEKYHRDCRDTKELDAKIKAMSAELHRKIDEPGFLLELQALCRERFGPDTDILQGVVRFLI
jgi:hypothetical protein